MNTEQAVNPKIELINFKDEECIKFTFNGHFSVKNAEYGVNEWKEFFDSARDQKIILIWDAVGMTGFDNKARVVWQHAIKDFKKQINCVWLISDSKVIIAGAKVMSAFTSFCLKAVKNTNQIKF